MISISLLGDGHGTRGHRLQRWAKLLRDGHAHLRHVDSETLLIAKWEIDRDPCEFGMFVERS